MKRFSTENTKQAYQSGKAFGAFIRMLSDLPGERLHDTIPSFHKTPFRLSNFEKALEADTHNRAAEVKADIDETLSYSAEAGILEALLEQRSLTSAAT